MLPTAILQNGAIKATVVLQSESWVKLLQCITQLPRYGK